MIVTTGYLSCTDEFQIDIVISFDYILSKIKEFWIYIVTALGYLGLYIYLTFFYKLLFKSLYEYKMPIDINVNGSGSVTMITIFNIYEM